MAAAAKSSAPYCWTLPDCTGRRPAPLSSATEAAAVDGAVDDLLVDVVVRRTCRRRRAPTPAPFTMASMTFWLNQYDARAIGPLMPATMTFS